MTDIEYLEKYLDKAELTEGIKRLKNGYQTRLMVMIKMMILITMKWKVMHMTSIENTIKEKINLMILKWIDN